MIITDGLFVFLITLHFLSFVEILPSGEKKLMAQKEGQSRGVGGDIY